MSRFDNQRASLIIGLIFVVLGNTANNDVSAIIAYLLGIIYITISLVQIWRQL